MGYNSWYDVLMNVDEANIRANADAMAANGLRDAGYKYLNLDDGLLSPDRTADGQLQVDASKFPSGLPSLVAYAASRGLQLGGYGDRGTQTCGGRAGSQGHEADDAAWWVGNGVMYLKEDSCYASTDHQTAFAQYAAMRDGLAAASARYNTSTAAFFSLCGWESWYSPVVKALGNSARIGPDDINFNGILSDIDDMAALWYYGGAAGFNDPCLLLGQGGDPSNTISEAQSRFQFSAWAVLAAPLLLSQDVRNMTAFRLATYTNPEVIAVSQDPLGRQGQRVGGGQLSMAPRSLTAHLQRRLGGDKPQGARLVDPRTLYAPAQLRNMRGAQWRDSDDNAPLTGQPCTPASAPASAQRWVWNASYAAPGYLSNVASTLCANIEDCGSALIGFTCVTSGGTCAGPDNYDGLVFSLGNDGTLRSPGAPGACVTSASTGMQLSMQQCVPDAPTQQWRYDPASQQLSQPANGLCVTLGAPPGANNATAIFARNLADGGIALAFLNAGLTPQSMVCDATCLATATGWEPEQVLSVRDLWARADLPDTTVAAGIAAPGGGQVPGDGGVALLRLTPKFNATLPPASTAAREM